MPPAYAWILLADRHPTEDTTYPVLTAAGRLRLAWWSGQQRAFPHLERGVVVTHWYPLPPPPAEVPADAPAQAQP